MLDKEHKRFKVDLKKDGTYKFEKNGVVQVVHVEDGQYFPCDHCSEFETSKLREKLKCW